MAANYNNLDELRSQKRLLKQEIGDLEDILTFKNKKQSLGVMTHGFTDKYLKETKNINGENELSLDTENIMREISSGIKESVSKKNMMGLANDSVRSGLLEDTLRIGAVTLVGNYAKKNMMNKSWKKKLIGAALIYVAPYALRFLRKKLDEYQRNRTTSSMEKLI